MKISVIGLGKIGLPLAVQFASKGHTVFGVDVNPTTVQQVNDGIEPFPGETDLKELLSSAAIRNNLTATLDGPGSVQQSDAVVIVVPLYVNNDGVPDFGWMDEATATVAKGLKPGTIVSYETTLPVGTTRARFAPALEAGSGLKAGKDFSLVFSPERVFSGRIFSDLRRYPKLVGGIDAASAERGVDLYSSLLDFDDRPDLQRPNGVWNLGSCEASELAKLAETTYRDVNIGLANQAGDHVHEQTPTTHRRSRTGLPGPPRTRPRLPAPQSRHPGGGLRAGRRRRCRRAPDRQKAGGEHRPDRGGGEQGGRRRQHRPPDRGQRACRWLLATSGLGRAADHRTAPGQAAL